MTGKKRKAEKDEPGPRAKKKSQPSSGRNHNIDNIQRQNNEGAGNSTAANTVLTTTQLVEKFLIGADIRTLLLSQRVNGKWQAVITGSPQLQRMAFPASRYFRRGAGPGAFGFQDGEKNPDAPPTPSWRPMRFTQPPQVLSTTLVSPKVAHESHVVYGIRPTISMVDRVGGEWRGRAEAHFRLEWLVDVLWELARLEVHGVQMGIGKYLRQAEVSGETSEEASEKERVS
ncbi:hypothetical protein B0A55_07887 [Friedmanniomyces simplex]|uniref:F-box domain-containing protein n=1 Tax=Friedmanniomyces simplex TaxID=329884 RepID=A0A4V5NFB6_9PEZI|nr:hypothetical protein B0A55_07887 [Friedmanniomyces simplex]